MQPSDHPVTGVRITSESERPTRARFAVLGLLCAMAFVLYLDRICMGQAAPRIQAQLELSNTRMGLLHMAFTLAYGLFEVPTGHWGDRFGSRRVLTRIVVWWSAFTALTGACTGFWSMLGVRFLFGAGEAGAYPNAARVLKRWFPAGERGRNQGLFLASSLVGGSVAPTLAARLIDAVDWRWTFAIFGGIGLVWAAVFAWWFRDDPDEHPAVNAAERELIGPAQSSHGHDSAIPWRRVFANRNIWLLGTIITLSSFNSYLYFSWYSTYLQRARGISNDDAGGLFSLVLIGGAVGTLCGGVIGDQITRAAARRDRLRRCYCTAAFGVAALLLALAVLCESPLATSLLAGASCLVMLSTQPIWWTCASEVSGRHLGALFGLMNAMGVLGAMASQFYFGAMADWHKDLGYTGRDQWDPAFAAYVLALVGAALCWPFVNTTGQGSVSHSNADGGHEESPAGASTESPEGC